MPSFYLFSLLFLSSIDIQSKNMLNSHSKFLALICQVCVCSGWDFQFLQLFFEVFRTSQPHIPAIRKIDPKYCASCIWKNFLWKASASLYRSSYWEYNQIIYYCCTSRCNLSIHLLTECYGRHQVVCCYATDDAWVTFASTKLLSIRSFHSIKSLLYEGVSQMSNSFVHSDVQCNRDFEAG